MSTMLDKMKDILDKMSGESSEEVDPDEPVESGSPLELAVEQALLSLNEIIIFGDYGRSAECAREARQAFEIISALSEKFKEQTRMMEVLSTPASELRDELRG